MKTYRYAYTNDTQTQRIHGRKLAHPNYTKALSKKEKLLPPVLTFAAVLYRGARLLWASCVALSHYRRKLNSPCTK